MASDRVSLAKKTAKETASTVVYQRLRQDILKGEFRPGQRLNIEFVAQRYGVGTNPVREALNRLSSFRLVDRRDQRGFFVPPIGVEDLRELVATRCWLESRAVEESIAHRDQAWEESLVLAYHRLSRAPWNMPGQGMVSGNPDWEFRHRAFHLALIANCGSQRLIGFCEGLMDQAERYRYIGMAATYPMRIVNTEHRDIMEAAIDGDVALTAQRLTDHYRLTLKIIEDQIGGDADAQPPVNGAQSVEEEEAVGGG
jgi:DNA-binding GntR family transcriptional regulator